MIPAQIPQDRSGWPPGVLDGLRQFRQGYVVADLPYFYYGDPAHPVLELTGDFANEGPGTIEAQRPFDFGLIATQTCDIAEEDSDRPMQPWVHLCPVYNAEASAWPQKREGAAGLSVAKLLDGETRSLVKKGRSQHLLYLPQLGSGCWVADLRLLLPVEKGWLISRTPINPFKTEAERMEVGRRLAWLHLRPAFDATFVNTVQRPLVGALRQLRRDQRATWDRLHGQVREIGVLTSQNIAIRAAEIIVLCNQALDVDLVEWLQERWTETHERAGTEGLNLLPLRIVLLQELSAAEYVTMTRLPLAAVSPEPPWYGDDPEQFPTG